MTFAILLLLAVLSPVLATAVSVVTYAAVFPTVLMFHGLKAVAKWGIRKCVHRRTGTA